MQIPDRRSRFWPALATLVGIAITASLGNWQLEPGGGEARVEGARGCATRPSRRSTCRPPRFRWRTSSSGASRRAAYSIRATRSIIDNRMHRGVPGYHVIMPLELEGSERYVLVNRGWIARPLDRSGSAARVDAARRGDGRGHRIAAVRPGARAVRARDGGPHLAEPHARALSGGNADQRSSRSSSARTRRLDDGLVREWDPPDFGIDKHYGYAFQWFALAATIVVFYAVTQFRRSRAQTRVARARCGSCSRCARRRSSPRMSRSTGWQPSAHVNYGELLEPRVLPDAPLRPARQADASGSRS